MNLPDSLVKQFTESTKDKPDAEKRTESYGTVVAGGVMLDGSSLVTPCESTVAVNPGDRVIVKIDKHQAVITGNTTSPALDETATEDVFESLIGDVEEGLQTQITQNAEAIELKASKSSVDDLEGRVSSAETNITQNANAITLKASQTSVDSLSQRVTSAETSITQNANAISSKASQSSVNSLGQRVTSAESTISQQATLISTKVSAGNIASSINQTAQSVKIAASKIDIDGIFTVNDYFKVLQEDDDYYNWIEVNDHVVFDDGGNIVAPNIIGNAHFGIQTIGTWDDTEGDYAGITIGEYEGEGTAILQIYCDTRGNVIIGETADEGVGVRIGTVSHPISYIRAKNLTAENFTIGTTTFTTLNATTVNATTIKENGTALSSKYAAYSHSHSGYASSSHTHSEYSKLLTVSSTSATISLSGNTYNTGSFSVSKSGYKVLGIVGYEISGSRSNYMNLYRHYTSGDTYYWAIRNNHSDTVSDSLTVYVLYVKN